MGLKEYNKKRDFKKTAEPEGKKPAGRAGDLTFVVQRHKASRLHYDFRLEMGSVLKSWAVPKGPSLNPEDKRLAMLVEDHPLDYAGFTGVIPEGNYGAGIVERWDRGTYTIIHAEEVDNVEKALLSAFKKGSLKIVLKGRKLKGEFALVKMHGAEENAWLLIKHRDRYAVVTDYSSEEHTPKNSPINKALKKSHASK